MRHAAAYRRGEDYDYDPNCPECKESKLGGTMEEWKCKNHTGELHSALAAWNWDAITSYYRHFPQGDDRLHIILPKLKIGLDIDEVLADFTSAWAKVHGIDERPECWNYHRNMGAEFTKMKEAGTLDDFYLSITPKIKPSDLPFEPHCYVTSRPVDTAITEKWLEIHKFPGSKVITVPLGTSKVQVLKDAGVDIFVDDAFHNFDELNRGGVCCFLMDAPHNQRYDVGFKRIKSLKELKY
jgi:5'(3')-deoxyribonucleotidase